MEFVKALKNCDYPLVWECVLGVLNNCLSEMVLLSNHSIWFD